MTFKLYQIADDYERAINQFFDSEENREAELEKIQDSFENKSIAVAKYIKGLEAEAAIIKEARDAMDKRYKAALKRAESLTDYLRYNIEKTGLAEKIKAPEFNIYLQNNPASLVIENAELIPDLYKIKKEVIEIDKNLIKQDIKDGFDVEGAKLVSTKRLVIK